MIDEYQDTNLMQADMVRLLAMNHRNVMAVGDDAQSIYSFRGANFRNIMDFPRFFPARKSSSSRRTIARSRESSMLPTT